jgi:putative SOS response-associated peptidase YedK
MCGRYVSPSERDLERLYGDLKIDPFQGVERIYNAAPSLKLPVLRMRHGELVGTPMQWGLIPYWWSKDELPASTINARIEDAATKPMWRDAAARARALVPALGWYEWQTVGGRKVPQYVQAADGDPVCFAGLWSRWKRSPDAEPLYTFAIVTRDALGALKDIHPRMPAVLPRSAWDRWLDPERTIAAEALDWLRTATMSDFRAYPVTTYVNAPQNQGERCVEPAEPNTTQTTQTTQMTFMPEERSPNR